MHAMVKKNTMVASITSNARIRIVNFQVFSKFASPVFLPEALMLY